MAALQVVTFIVAAVLFFSLYRDKNNLFPLFAQSRSIGFQSPPPAPVAPGDGKAAMGLRALLSGVEPSEKALLTQIPSCKKNTTGEAACFLYDK